MTPERKRALQWFHDRGEVKHPWDQSGGPSYRIMMLMVQEGQVDWTAKGGYSLTDKGRRMLHGDHE